MSTSEESTSGDAALPTLTLVGAAPEAEPRRRSRFGVPRIVDYMIVAAVIYFLL